MSSTFNQVNRWIWLFTHSSIAWTWNIRATRHRRVSESCEIRWELEKKWKLFSDLAFTMKNEFHSRQAEEERKKVHTKISFLLAFLWVESWGCHETRLTLVKVELRKLRPVDFFLLPTFPTAHRKLFSRCRRVEEEKVFRCKIGNFVYVLNVFSGPSRDRDGCWAESAECQEVDCWTLTVAYVSSASHSLWVSVFFFSCVSSLIGSEWTRRRKKKVSCESSSETNSIHNKREEKNVQLNIPTAADDFFVCLIQFEELLYCWKGFFDEQKHKTPTADSPW